jgi:hypothetical protein
MYAPARSDHRCAAARHHGLQPTVGNGLCAPGTLSSRHAFIAQLPPSKRTVGRVGEVDLLNHLHQDIRFPRRESAVVPVTDCYCGHSASKRAGSVSSSGNRATPPSGSIKEWDSKGSNFDLDAWVERVDNSGASFAAWSARWGHSWVDVRAFALLWAD